MQADKSKKSTEALEKEVEQNKAEEKAQKHNMRDQPEDKGKAARQTTPTGKGRSQ